MPNGNDRRTFTIEDAKNIPLDVLKNSYFFLDQDLTLRRLTTETRPGTGDMKGAVNTHTIEDVVVISRDTKGKLLELFEKNSFDCASYYKAIVQFDTDESCSLEFSGIKDYCDKDSECNFSISLKDTWPVATVQYNEILYHVDMDARHGNRYLEFQLRGTTETVTTKAKGAW